MSKSSRRSRAHALALEAGEAADVAEARVRRQWARQRRRDRSGRFASGDATPARDVEMARQLAFAGVLRERGLIASTGSSERWTGSGEFYGYRTEALPMHRLKARFDRELKLLEDRTS